MIRNWLNRWRQKRRQQNTLIKTPDVAVGNVPSKPMEFKPRVEQISRSRDFSTPESDFILVEQPKPAYAPDPVREQEVDLTPNLLNLMLMNSVVNEVFESKPLQDAVGINLDSPTESLPTDLGAEAYVSDTPAYEPPAASYDLGTSETSYSSNDSYDSGASSSNYDSSSSYDSGSSASSWDSGSLSDSSSGFDSGTSDGGW